MLVMGYLMIRAADGVEAPPQTKKNLSDEEYLQAVTEIMTDYKADRQATLDRLAELDTELVCRRRSVGAETLLPPASGQSRRPIR